MKTLKESLKMHESVLDIDSNLEKDDIRTLIEDWLKKHNIHKYEINDDSYTIKPLQCVNIENYKESKLPDYITFDNTDRTFGFSRGNIRDLRGCPRVVKQDFFCSNCGSLESLVGGPEEVGERFTCEYCTGLESLEGAPKKVTDFICRGCHGLKTLKGAPKKIKGYFDCSYCSRLRDLEGSPEEIGRYFDCEYCNNLESIKGAPKKVGTGFDCYNCPNLEIEDEYLPKITKS